MADADTTSASSVTRSSATHALSSVKVRTPRCIGGSASLKSTGPSATCEPIRLRLDVERRDRRHFDAVRRQYHVCARVERRLDRTVADHVAAFERDIERALLREAARERQFHAPLTGDVLQPPLRHQRPVHDAVKVGEYASAGGRHPDRRAARAQHAARERNAALDREIALVVG